MARMDAPQIAVSRLSLFHGYIIDHGFSIVYLNERMLPIFFFLIYWLAVRECFHRRLLKRPRQPLSDPILCKPYIVLRKWATLTPLTTSETHTDAGSPSIKPRANGCKLRAKTTTVVFRERH